jgi:hypothetical protein
MDPEKILFVLRLPARLTVPLVAMLLNFHAEAIYYLVDIGLLETIGPSEGVQLYFEAGYVNRLRHNSAWIAKATAAWRAHTAQKNARQNAKNSRKRRKRERFKPATPGV